MKVYLVRNRTTGEYLKGQTLYQKRWVPGVGRTYDSVGMAKRSVAQSPTRIKEADWEVVEFELKEKIDVRSKLSSV